MLVEEAAYAVNDGAQLLRPRLVADADDGMKPELVARGKRLEAHVRNLAVRDAHYCAIGRAHACRAQPYVIDRALHLANLESVADAHGLIEHKRGSSDHILQRFLRCERHRNAPDAQARQRGRRVHPEMAKDGQKARENHEKIPHPAEQPNQRCRGWLPQAWEAALDVALDLTVEKGQHPYDPGNGKKARDVGPELPHEQTQRQADTVQRIASARISSRTGAGSACGRTRRNVLKPAR